MPSLVADHGRKQSPNSVEVTKGSKDQTPTKNKMQNAVKKNTKPLQNQKTRENLADAPEEGTEKKEQNALVSVDSSGADEAATKPTEKKTHEFNSRRNSLDKKPPIRASPRASPPKPKKPNSPIAKKQSIKKDCSDNPEPKVNTDTTEEYEQQQLDQHQQQQQQTKLFNNNALHLLKLARASHLSGDNPLKAIDYASRAATLLEKEENSEATNLEMVLCLHIVAAGYCRLGRYDEAIKVLESSLLIPDIEQGSEHALAVFASHMQLGDTLTLVGKHEKALAAYHSALQVQKQVLGDMDLRVAETCRYVSEAHLQVMQFEEAEKLCEHILEIHSKHSPAGSVDEAIDRKLMALIHAGKGEYEQALEHLVLASTTLSCSGQELDVASVDCSIGEAYFALGRYDEAVFSYQKALTILKSSKGESHATVASVYVSLAELYLKTGKQREAKTYCENALKIFGKQNAGHAADELSSGLVEVAGVYEAMGEREQALSLLRRALEILELAPGEQSAAAGVEAQIGVLLYVMGKYGDAHVAFQNAVSKLKFGTEKETSFLGVLFNQLGLASVELQELSRAAKEFEEARRILTNVEGAHHLDTLSVCSNLAGCYDALGRVEDAIELLENVVEVKEEQLGTVHPDVTRERERLLLLLKGVGRGRARKTSTLEQLLLLPHPQAAIH